MAACAWCDGDTEATTAVRRALDGVPVGPEIPLCDDHAAEACDR